MIARFFVRALLASFMVSPLVAWADFTATPEEKRMCDATIWSRKVPGNPNWAHVHHYCDCVRFTNRAYRFIGKDKREFTHNLTEAVSGCDYVISHATPDFDLLPEIYLQKGTIYSLLGRNAQAAAEFTKALSGNPNLAKAYIGMANFFVKADNKKKALETISEGLAYNPESKAMKRMYRELGGQMPYPAAKKPVAAKPEVNPEAAATSAPAAAAPPETHAMESAKKAETAAPATTPVPYEIGSPTNPWCRFCPDTPAAPPATTPSMPGVVPKAD